jgi:hypothetical protein
MSAADKASIHRMLQKIGDLPPDPPPPPAPIPSRVLKFDETERAKNDASVLDAARAALDAARTDAGKAFAQSKRSADLSRAVGDADDRRRNSTGEARLDASHDFLVAVKALEDAREDAIKSSPEYKSAFDSVTQALVTQANDKADYAAHPTTVPVDGLGPPPVP